MAKRNISTKKDDLRRKQINKAASTYLCDQPEGDLYGAYKELLQASEDGYDDKLADAYVVVWEPLASNTSVAKMIQLIEDNIDDNEMPELYKSIDWNLLKEQKKTLLKVIEDCDNVPVLEHLEGILVLIDEIQDDAVDNFGVDENLVFDLHDDDDKVEPE